MVTYFPVIDPVATGENITRLRKAKGLTVRQLQQWFGFEEPQAIYKWQRGKSLPSVDNLYALGHLLNVPMEDILVPYAQQKGEPLSFSGSPSLFCPTVLNTAGFGNPFPFSPCRQFFHPFCKKQIRLPFCRKAHMNKK